MVRLFGVTFYGKEMPVRETIRKNIFHKALLSFVGGVLISSVCQAMWVPFVIADAARRAEEFKRRQYITMAAVGVNVPADATNIVPPGTESVWAVNDKDEVFVATSAAQAKVATIQIVSANYGDFIASTKDVTDDLKVAVKKAYPKFPLVNRVELSNNTIGSKADGAFSGWQAAVFPNPIWGVRKKLKVEYMINDQKASQEIMEGDPLIIEAPALASIGWKKVDGALKHVAVGPFGVWGVNAADLIWFRAISPSNLEGTVWTQVGGNLKQVDVGQHGDVWGVNKDDDIFMREGVTPQNPTGTAWKQVDGKLKYLSVGDDIVWGVNADGIMWYREGITRENRLGTGWKKVEGWATKISVFGNNVWHIGGNNTPYYVKDGIPTNPAGTGWNKIENTFLTHVSLGLYTAWGIGNDGKTPYVCAGMDQYHLGGTKWVKVDGSFKQIDIGYVIEPAAVYDVKTSSGADIKPGGGSIVINGRKGNGLIGNMTFGWELPKAGEGLITFKGKAKQDIVTVLAPTAKYEDVKSLTLSIGAYSNTKTYLRTVAMSDKDQKAFVDDFVIQPDFNDYWIMVKDNTFSYGKGLLPGFNPIVTWSDSMIGTLKYVAFGCWEDFKVELSDIKILPVPEYIEPIGFTEEEGEAVSVTVGSRTVTEEVVTKVSTSTPAKTTTKAATKTAAKTTAKTAAKTPAKATTTVTTQKTTKSVAELEAWAIGKDGGLFRYNRYSMASMPWERITAKNTAGLDLKVKLASASSDGLLYVVTAGSTDKESVVYSYDWDKKNFVQLAGTTPALTRISVGNAKELWAVTIDKDVIRYDATTKAWVVIDKGVGQDIAAGVDGTVVSINTKGEVFKYLGDNKWEQFPGVEFARVAVGSKNFMWAIDKLGGLWAYDVKANKWDRAQGKENKPVMGIVDVGVNAAGSTFLIDFDYDISLNKDDGYVIAGASTTTKETRTVAKKTGKIKVTPKKQKKAAKKIKLQGKKAKVATKKSLEPSKLAKVQAGKESAKRTTKTSGVAKTTKVVKAAVAK